MFVILVVVPLWVTARHSTSPAICPTDITLTTQAQVDAFATTYTCTELTGMLTISGADITNLHGLSAITSIGTLYISGNNALTNLDGLSNLTTVGNTCSCFMPGLVIENNAALTNLQGLASLSLVEGNLKLSNNSQLVNLTGLEAITSIGAMLDIDNHAQLISINALSGVTTVGIWHLSNQSVRISNNASLTRISILNGITSLPGELMIENNASLTEVDGFSSLTQINGLRANLFITGNTLLTSINGFAALTTITGGGGGGVITISNNAALTTMNGFSSLTHINGGITGGLIISNNPALTEGDGLSQLISITGGNFYLKVMDNPLLDRGCGLYQLLSTDGVGGAWCPNSTCPAITISGNGLNCTREIILSGGACSPVVACPADKVVFAENSNGCGSLSTSVVVQNSEHNVLYTLRLHDDNTAVAGPLDGTSGLLTGVITNTTMFNVLARNSDTGCETVMSTLPIVTVHPLPLDKLVVAETESGCGSLSTQIFIEDYEPSISYSLHSNENNGLVAGPSPGSAGLATGTLTTTSRFNIVARNEATDCETKMSTEPIITIYTVPQDYPVVAENDSIFTGTSTTIRVPEGELGVLYTLRRNGDNLIIAGPLPGPAILPTGILSETTTYNVLANCEHCEKELSTQVTVTVVPPPVVTGTPINTTASLSFYPNPSNGEFQIQFANDLSGHYHISLYNLTGSLVKEKSIDALDTVDSVQLDLTPLPAGTYFVSITGPDGIHLRRRLVITN